VTALLLAALIAIPAAGVLAVPHRSIALLQRMLAVTVAVWLAAAFVWLWLFVSGVSPADARVEIATLIPLEVAESQIALIADLSSTRVGLLLTGLLLMLPIVLQPDAVLPSAFGGQGRSFGIDETERRSEIRLRLSLAILPSSALALLSDDLIVVVAAWLLLDALLIRFADVRATEWPAAAEGASRNAVPGGQGFLLTVLRVSSLALLAAVLLATTRYRTTSLAGFIETAIADERVEAGMVRGGILVWFAIAVAARAALFPIGIWLRPLAESPSRDALPIVAWAAILPAAGVWLSLSPLVISAPEGGLLISVLGGLSGVMFGMIGLSTRLSAQRSSSSSSTALHLLVTGGAFALMSIAVPSLAMAANGSPLSSTGTVILLANGVAVSVLFLPGPRFGARLVAAAILLSGAGGPNYLLDQLQSVRRTLVTVDGAEQLSAPAAASISPEVVTALWWSVCVTQFLIGCLVTCHLMRCRSCVSVADHDDTQNAASGAEPHAEPDDGLQSEATSGSELAAPAMLVLGSLACVALSATALPEAVSVPSGSMQTEVSMPAVDQAVVGRLLSFNAATPSGLLGAVSVWLVSLMSVGLRNQLRDRAASLQRLASHWFYVGAAVEGLRLVIGWVAVVVEVCDRRVLGGQKEGTWRQNASRIARGVEEIDEHGPGYPSLAALLAVVGLLLALSGFGR